MYVFSDQMDHGVELPDGEEDYQRRKKRAAEFSSRLSRNYLYQLSKEVQTLNFLANIPLHIFCFNLF